jgi:cell division protein FtsB
MADNNSYKSRGFNTKIRKVAKNKGAGLRSTAVYATLQFLKRTGVNVLERLSLIPIVSGTTFPMSVTYLTSYQG